ncbi:MAG: MipA/OmpV family protein [Croceibacterium sp.]
MGVQTYPSYPGADKHDLAPLFNVDRARGDDPFPFEAPDQGFDLALVKSHGFSFGPVLNFENSRKPDDVGAAVPKVKLSIEPGVFASVQLTDSFRLRGDVRKGVTGHKGWIGDVGADYVVRNGDNWLFSIGPRVSWSSNRYQDAYFGVSPEASLTSGLPTYNPGSGIMSYGATSSFLTQLSRDWGIMAYAKYDRLVGDAADSPLVQVYGSRNQLSGGLALSYTFGGGR